MRVLSLMRTACQAAHASRRDRLMKVAAHETATSLAFLQFSAGSHVTMTNDIPYRWRQQSDFLYLTGFEEGDSALLMVSTGLCRDWRRVAHLRPIDVCSGRQTPRRIVCAAARCGS